MQEAFIGEPSGDPSQPLENYAEGDEAVAIDVKSGKLQLVVPAATSDDDIFETYTFLGGELQLEDGRVLTFQIQGGAVGAQVAVLAENARDRGVGLSSIPDVPGGV